MPSSASSLVLLLQEMSESTNLELFLADASLAQLAEHALHKRRSRARSPLGLRDAGRVASRKAGLAARPAAATPAARGIIRYNWNDTEKISTAPAQG